MNILTNIFLRATGIAPLTGPIPLSEEQQKNLFQAQTSFVDYFPIIEYLQEDGTFLLEDGINVAGIWELTAADMDAKPPETLAQFNDGLADALAQLPTEENNPYIVQLFLENSVVDNMGESIYEQLPKHLKKDQLSLAVVEMFKNHHELLTHTNGAFQDSRVSGEKGWRVAQKKIYCVIYRRESESYWKKSRKSPSRKLLDDVGSFLASLNGIRVNYQMIDDLSLINWLGNYFGKGFFDKNNQIQHEARKTLANYDIGQQCFPIQPEYQASKEEEERGIYKFGENYIRYLTTEGIQSPPKDGCLSIGKSSVGNDKKGFASVWEQIPEGSMMTWTLIPQPAAHINRKIDYILAVSQGTESEAANHAEYSARQAKDECLKNNQRIFYTQIGAFISAQSIDKLLEKTTTIRNVITQTSCLKFINPKYDLISQDSFIRALPTVYDFNHDRKSALRARMTYLSHLSATLPLFGSGVGSGNICYLTYKRSGEPFTCNPYIKSDRSRVAHAVIFGPTGSGKSATMNYMLMMSMAVNGPRQFILDKGNSFKLLGDYYERMGKKVNRMTFNAASTDTFPPFFATRQALAEVSHNDDYLNQVDDAEMEDVDADKRSYLSEMLNIIKIMVTGGREDLAKDIKQSDLEFMQSSLLEALRRSEANNQAHARPQDVYEVMLEKSREEDSEQFKVRFREMASAVKLWTDGERGRLFNRYGVGFDEDADLTIIETGSLTESGKEDMFAIAGLSTLTNITALGEKTQFDGRHVEVFVDEGHYWMRLKLLVRGMIEATKVWRKLGVWLVFATQDFSDFDKESQKILSQSEFWWLLSMGEDEAKQIMKFKDLSDEEKHLIRQAIIEKPNYTEGTLLSDRFGCGLNRYIPPSLIFALAQTDADEKNDRKRRMDEHGFSELDAAIQIGEEIDLKRRAWQKKRSGENA